MRAEPPFAGEDPLLALVPRLRGLAFAIVRDWQLAEDVSQEVLLRALAGGFRHRGVRHAWLKAMARHLALNLLRERKRRRAREERGARAESVAPEPSQLEVLEAHRQLLAAVAALAAEQREVVMLRFFEERDWPAIASRLGLSVPAAQMRLHRALAALRALLAARGRDWQAPCLAAIPAGWMPALGSRSPMRWMLLAQTAPVAWTGVAAGLLILLLAAGWLLWSEEPAAPGKATAPGTLAAARAGTEAPSAVPALVREPIRPQELAAELPPELVLHPVPVAGRVYHQGRSVEGAAVEVRQAGRLQTAVTDAEGVFRLRMDPHAVALVLARKGDLRGSDRTDNRWGGPPWPCRVNLEAVDAPRSHVRVVEAGTLEPVPGARVSVYALDFPGASELCSLPLASRGRRLGAGVTDADGRFGWEEDGWGSMVLLDVQAEGFRCAWTPLDEDGVEELQRGADPCIRLLGGDGLPLAGALIRYGAYGYRECRTEADGSIPAAMEWEGFASAPRLPDFWALLPSGRWWCSASLPDLAEPDASVRAEQVELRIEDSPIRVILEAGALPAGCWIEAAANAWEDHSLPTGPDSDCKDPEQLGTSLHLDHPWERLEPEVWVELMRGPANARSVMARVQPQGLGFGPFPIEQGRATVRVPAIARLELVIEDWKDPNAWQPYLSRREHRPFAEGFHRPVVERSGTVHEPGRFVFWASPGRYALGFEDAGSGCAFHWRDEAFQPGASTLAPEDEILLPEGLIRLRGALRSEVYRRVRLTMEGYPVHGGMLGGARIDLDGRTMLRLDDQGRLLGGWPSHLFVPPEVAGAPHEPVHTLRIVPDLTRLAAGKDGELLVDIRLATVRLSPDCIQPGQNQRMFLQQLPAPAAGGDGWTAYEDARHPFRSGQGVLPLDLESPGWSFRIPAGRYRFELRTPGGADRTPLSAEAGVLLEPGSQTVLVRQP